jgi:xanthine dehydrogenase YagT iron-sulfur-binding subunit
MAEVNHATDGAETARAGVSRRDFVKGAGASAASTALLDSGLAQAAPGSIGAAETYEVLGPGVVPVSLSVNGRNVSVRVDPATTLVEVLRNELGLTGTKIGCDRGACSACTVWLDGEPASSCVTLALDARGRKITTIEGLAEGDELHAVQQAFVEHDALQCASIVMGWVAPTPRRASESERLLVGNTLNEDLARRAASAAVAGATPLSKTATRCLSWRRSFGGRSGPRPRAEGYRHATTDCRGATHADRLPAPALQGHTRRQLRRERELRFRLHLDRDVLVHCHRRRCRPGRLVRPPARLRCHSNLFRASALAGPQRAGPLSRRDGASQSPTHVPLLRIPGP